MLKKSEKETIINDLKSDMEKSSAFFLTNLIGIGANDAVLVRKNVRDSGGKVVVTRNSLFEKAAQGKSYEALLKGLKGPHAIAFAFKDAAAVAKSLKKSGAELELVTLKGGVLDGKTLTSNEVKALAELPSKDQMLGLMLATFIAPVSALVRVLDAIRIKNEGTSVSA